MMLNVQYLQKRIQPWIADSNLIVWFTWNERAVIKECRAVTKECHAAKEPHC